MPVSLCPTRPRRLAGAALLLAALPAAAATVEVRALGSDGQPLPETVVFLESAEARAAARPLQGAEIVQVERRFVPRVSVVTAGTAVSFPNRDTVRHHVYSFSAIKPFDLKLYAGTPANPVAFDKPGIAVLGCNIHDTMAAWVVIVETPHHGQTAANGHLRLADVPPGSYRLRAWHADLPSGAPALEQALQLPAQGAQAQLRLAVQGVEGAKT